MRSISVSELANQLERRKPLRLLDVRRAQALAASGVQIAGAQWKDPALWLDWKDEIAHDLPIVVYCAHGHEISQGLTATLQAMGLTPVTWRAEFPHGRHKVNPSPPLRWKGVQQKWISRERPKIDRIAFPWLIRKFIDSDAEFLSVADSEVRKIAADTGATPYDITDRQLLMSMSALEKAVRQTLCQERVFRSQSTFSEPDRQN